MLDLYRQGKAAEGELSSFQATRNQSPSPQAAVAIFAKYFANYHVQPQLDANGNLTNPPNYYPKSDANTDAASRQKLEQEWLATPKQTGEQGFQFTEAQPQETGAQYRARYTAYLS